MTAKEARETATKYLVERDDMITKRIVNEIMIKIHEAAKWGNFHTYAIIPDNVNDERVRAILSKLGYEINYMNGFSKSIEIVW